MTLRSAIFPLVVMFVTSIQETSAQAPVQDPRDSSRSSFNGGKISVSYGKPAVRGRRIFGDVVPFYKVWRTGAGEATMLRTDVDLEMDGAVIPKGEYSLFSIPAEDRWKIIVNKQTGQWGTEYHSEQDLARIDVMPQPLAKPVENLSIRSDKNSADEGVLRMEWEHTSIAMKFRISHGGLIASPRDSSALLLTSASITVNYGRPSMRGRTIFGGIVPYGAVWRTGANAATSFVTTADLLIGGAKVPRGAYTLYSIPGSREWRIVVNKQVGQWGTVYDAKQDLVRIRVKRKPLKDPIEQLTITLNPNERGGGEMRLSWEKTLLVLPIEVQQAKKK
jgi:hypothetical protein